MREIEQRAQSATKWSAFQVNLQRIRDTVELIYKEFGRYGFFDEYTDHSFEHVDGMLAVAEWIIPDQCKSILTDGDWFMIVLAIYFHDVGLLISRNEFEKRHTNPDFQAFVAKPAIPSEKSNDFKARIASLSTDEIDRFWYQEFVRFTHGARIRSWIDGYELDDGGSSTEIRNVITELLQPLDATFRRDLGAICESHTIDDIGDIRIFKLAQPYGDDERETVNLQYAAAILRSVDLLHISRKRAPSVLFQLINPTDPISQIEWLKQGAVRSVRKKIATDREGNPSPATISDTIDVHARFHRAEGFFGLTHYLQYAEKELFKTHNIISRQERHLPSPPLFPWKFVNVDNIEADGFLTSSFGFSLDQHKILELLTGHTLYNDTSVVLRELMQNSLDAIRLQALLDNKDSSQFGLLDIHWDSRLKILTVTDNGTGMSQEIIEQHLLTVGSSRYQDEKFKEKNPNFSSISRFGIGVLSAFMVSDHVEITTCFPDELKARRIELRSLHGKYLIKLLDKVADRDELKIYPHGTSVRLFLRASAEIGDVLQTARAWLMFPRSKVLVRVDDNPAVEVGFSGPKQAVEDIISKIGQKNPWFRFRTEAREFTENGITLAFAVSRTDYQREWTFVPNPKFRGHSEAEEESLVATCVEGVGVDFRTPGFIGTPFIAVANAVGKQCPKTNVARSALEDTPEYRNMLNVIYRLYCRHISDEIERLSQDEDYSLSRAISDSQFVVNRMLGGDVNLVNRRTFAEELANLPFALVEVDGSRRNVSINELRKENGFWTVNSPFSLSVETFIRESPSNVTAENIVNVVGNKSAKYPNGITLCNYDDVSRSGDLGAFEISHARAFESLRRLDLKWNETRTNRNWVRSGSIIREIRAIDDEIYGEFMPGRRQGIFDIMNVYFSNSMIVFDGLDKYTGFSHQRSTYIKYGTKFNDYFFQLASERENPRDLLKFSFCLYLFNAIIYLGDNDFREFEPDYRRDLDGQARKAIGNSGFSRYKFDAEFKEIVELANTSPIKIFSPSSWDRKDRD